MSVTAPDSAPRRKDALLQRHDAILGALARAGGAGLDVVGIHRALYAMGRRFCARTVYSDLRALCERGLVQRRLHRSGRRASTCYALGIHAPRGGPPLAATPVAATPGAAAAHASPMASPHRIGNVYSLLPRAGS